MRRLLSEYQSRYDALENAYQRSHSAAELFEIIEAATPISRAAGNMRDALQSAREYVEEDPLLIAMRDEAYAIARNFELLLSDARGALDYRIARHAEAQADRAEQLAISQHKLNVLAAITFPLLIVATLFGMNLSSGFEQESPLWFYGVFVLGLIVGLLVLSWVMNSGNKRG
ncbi:MAG: hypothetical protein JW888_16620 [Pirellulales bacterium]|nr:hypothetical protein [Pirellulales bacterium]